MSRIRKSAAALLMMVSGSTFAAGPTLPLPIPTLPGVALGQVLGSLSLPGAGGLPSLGSLPILAGGLPSAPQPVVLLLGNLTVAMGPYARQLPLVGLVEAGDPVLRPIITPLSNAVYIPVVGAAFGNN